MILIKGEYFSGESTKAYDATLHYDGLKQLKVVYPDGEAICDLETANFTSRLGNIPRYLYFSNGAKFVANDNEAIDDLLSQVGVKQSGKLLHTLESQSVFVVAFLALLIATIIYTITVVIPRFADETASMVPSEFTQMISQSAIETFDNKWFMPSEVPLETQNMLQSEFEFLAEPYAGELQFRLHIRKSDVLPANALALPSGDIYVTDSLLKIAKNRDEILAVLAHEMGHIVHRHGIRRLFEDSLIAVLIFGVTGDTTFISQAAVVLPILLVSRKYSRDYELEADQFAHKVMSDNNMSHEHFANILQRIDEVYKDYPGVTTYFSTHPETEKRINQFQNNKP